MFFLNFRVRLRAWRRRVMLGTTRETGGNEWPLGPQRHRRELNGSSRICSSCFAPGTATGRRSTRYKHAPLNTYVSFSHTPAGQESEGDCTLGDALPGPAVNDPSLCVIST